MWYVLEMHILLVVYLIHVIIYFCCWLWYLYAWFSIANINIIAVNLSKLSTNYNTTTTNYNSMYKVNISSSFYIIFIIFSSDWHNQLHCRKKYRLFSLSLLMLLFIWKCIVAHNIFIDKRSRPIHNNIVVVLWCHKPDIATGECFQVLCFTMQLRCIALGYMSFLEHMGFVLVVFLWSVASS